LAEHDTRSQAERTADPETSRDCPTNPAPPCHQLQYVQPAP
jgi:hypothetical protein